MRHDEQLTETSSGRPASLLLSRRQRRISSRVEATVGVAGGDGSTPDDDAPLLWRERLPFSVDSFNPVQYKLRKWNDTITKYLFCSGNI